MRSFVQIQVFARGFHLCLSCPSSPAVILDPRRRTSRTGAATPPAVIPDLSCCHPRSSIKNVKDRLRSGIQPSVMPGLIGHPGFLGFRCLERRGTTRRSFPTGSWCLCVGAGLGARPSFLFSCGVSPPRDEGRRIVGCRPHATRSFCFGKRTQNQWRPGGAPQRGCLCPGPWCVGCGTRCAQTVLAPKMEGTGPGHSPARRRQDNCKE